MRKILMSLSIIFLFSCNTARIDNGSNSAISSGSGRNGSAPDTSGTYTSADPDGITGSGSTYGTRTGVSGQTSSGTGSGSGNTDKSGVGIKINP